MNPYHFEYTEFRKADYLSIVEDSNVIESIAFIVKVLPIGHLRVSDFLSHAPPRTDLVAPCTSERVYSPTSAPPTSVHASSLTSERELFDQESSNQESSPTSYQESSPTSYQGSSDKEWVE